MVVEAVSGRVIARLVQLFVLLVDPPKLGDVVFLQPDG